MYHMLYLPLWYYILREARVKKAGNKLGPVGSRILTDTFAKILIQDEESILRKDIQYFLLRGFCFFPKLKIPFAK